MPVENGFRVCAPRLFSTFFLVWGGNPRGRGFFLVRRCRFHFSVFFWGGRENGRWQKVGLGLWSLVFWAENSLLVYLVCRPRTSGFCPCIEMFVCVLSFFAIATPLGVIGECAWSVRLQKTLEKASAPLQGYREAMAMHVPPRAF